MTDTNGRILSIQDVASRIGVHITTIDRWCAAGVFVPKIRLGPGRVGFASEDVDVWLAKRRADAAST
jgi:predicted DNA-binding transcriptional regulator AlpA